MAFIHPFKHFHAIPAEQVIPMCHPVERRSKDKRYFRGQSVAQAIEQPEREGLICHTGPVVEKFVATAPDTQAWMFPQSRYD